VTDLVLSNVNAVVTCAVATITENRNVLGAPLAKEAMMSDRNIVRNPDPWLTFLAGLIVGGVIVEVMR
jgi:uncharacterized membrane protein